MQHLATRGPPGKPSSARIRPTPASSRSREDPLKIRYLRKSPGATGEATGGGGGDGSTPPLRGATPYHPLLPHRAPVGGFGQVLAQVPAQDPLGQADAGRRSGTAGTWGIRAAGPAPSRNPPKRLYRYRCHPREWLGYAVSGIDHSDAAPRVCRYRPVHSDIVTLYYLCFGRTWGHVSLGQPIRKMPRQQRHNVTRGTGPLLRNIKRYAKRHVT